MQRLILMLSAVLAIIAGHTNNKGFTKSMANLPFMKKVQPVYKPTSDQITTFRKGNSKPKVDFIYNGANRQDPTAGITPIRRLIIGGSRALRGQFPWQVVISLDDAALCGGSIITQTHILTAAHCIYGVSLFIVSYGGIDRTKNEAGENTMSTRNATFHESFDPITLQNDIGILNLPSSIRFNNFARPIQLPRWSDASKTFSNTKVTASGFGLTKNDGVASNVLNFVHLVVIENSECYKTYQNIVISSTLCTAADQRKSICSGDSGGPLIYKEINTKFTQIGVVSFGSALSCIKSPNGYARLTSFLGWITKNCNIALRK